MHCWLYVIQLPFQKLGQIISLNAINLNPQKIYAMTNISHCTACTSVFCMYCSCVLQTDKVWGSCLYSNFQAGVTTECKKTWPCSWKAFILPHRILCGYFISQQRLVVPYRFTLSQGWALFLIVWFWLHIWLVLLPSTIHWRLHGSHVS